MSWMNSEFCHLWRTRMTARSGEFSMSFTSCGLASVGVVLDEVGIDVPRVPFLRLINESLQQVAARLPVRQRAEALRHLAPQAQGLRCCCAYRRGW